MGTVADVNFTHHLSTGVSISIATHLWILQVNLGSLLSLQWTYIKNVMLLLAWEKRYLTIMNSNQAWESAAGKVKNIRSEAKIISTEALIALNQH